MIEEKIYTQQQLNQAIELAITDMNIVLAKKQAQLDELRESIHVIGANIEIQQEMLHRVEITGDYDRFKNYYQHELGRIIADQIIKEGFFHERSFEDDTRCTVSKGITVRVLFKNSDRA